MKEYELKFMKLENGEKLAYRFTGAGDPTYLLIHGNMSSSLHWTGLMEKLSSNGKVYAVDLRGFGNSSYKNEINSLRDFALDIKEFILNLKLSNLVIVGWSTGGGIALELSTFSEMKDKISKVFLVESIGIQGYPNVKIDSEGKIVEGEYLISKEEIKSDPVQMKPLLLAYENGNREYIKYLWDTLIYNEKRPDEDEYEKYIDEILNQRNFVDVRYALGKFNMTNEDREYNKGIGNIKDIESEIIIIHGKKDLVVPISHAQLTHKYLKDKSKLIVFENEGHSPMTDNLDLLYNTILMNVENN